MISTEANTILFIRGGAGSGGFLHGGSDPDEQLADITNTATFSRNHGWYEFAQEIRSLGFDTLQVIEESGDIPVDFSTIPWESIKVVVFGSNNATYSAQDAEFLDSWVRSGGAALFISDADFGSYWNDAPTSDQTFLNKFDLVMNQDRGTYKISVADSPFPSHPIFEDVTSFNGEGVSPITVVDNISDVNPVILSYAKEDIRRNNKPFGSVTPATENDGALVVARVGSGRIAAHYDRNTFFNLNGAGTSIHKLDNRQYARNLFQWLAGQTETGQDSLFSGKPNYNPSNYDGLVIWKEDDLWTIEATGDLNGSRFTGQVIANASIGSISRYGLEKNDKVVIDQSRKIIDFQLNVGEHWTDGFRFRVSEGTSLTLNLNNEDAVSIKGGVYWQDVVGNPVILA